MRVRFVFTNIRIPRRWSRRVKVRRRPGSENPRLRPSSQPHHHPGPRPISLPKRRSAVALPSPGLRSSRKAVVALAPALGPRIGEFARPVAMCEDHAVIGIRRHSRAARVSVVVLAAFVLCPLMAGMAAAAPAPSCHEAPAPEPGEGFAAPRCCDAVVAEQEQSAPEAAAVSAPTGSNAVVSARCPKRRTEGHGPGSQSPPLFLRHAALLR